MKNAKKLQTKTSHNSNHAKDSKNTKRTRRKRKRDILRITTKKIMIKIKLISMAFAHTSKKKPLRIQRKNQKSILVQNLKMNSKDVTMI